MLSRSSGAFDRADEMFGGFGNLSAMSLPAESGGGDSAPGVGERVGGTMVRGALLSVDGISILSSSCGVGSGGFRLVEIVCQIATSSVKVHTVATMLRTIKAVVGIMADQKGIILSDLEVKIARKRTAAGHKGKWLW